MYVRSMSHVTPLKRYRNIACLQGIPLKVLFSDLAAAGGENKLTCPTPHQPTAGQDAKSARATCDDVHAAIRCGRRDTHHDFTCVLATLQHAESELMLRRHVEAPHGQACHCGHIHTLSNQ